MTNLILKGQKRTVLGKKVKKLRSIGKLPANIYGKKLKSQAIQIDTSEFSQVLKKAGETNIIDLKIEGENKTRPVLATNLQTDPVTDLPLHVDFHQVDLTQKVSVAIPVEFVGESLAVKEKGGVLITLLDEIKIEALPKDLPDKFVVDISKLNEFNDNFLVKNLDYDKQKIELQVDENEPVVMVQEPKEEEEAMPTEAVESEVDEGAEAEGEEGKKVEAKKEETKESEEKETAEKKGK